MSTLLKIIIRFKEWYFVNFPKQIVSPNNKILPRRT